jgi:cardiolipin synthase
MTARRIPEPAHEKRVSPAREKAPAIRWLWQGREIFPAMHEAIAEAARSIRLETYIYTDGKVGRQMLAALTQAARRGVKVQVLVDAIGSWFLPDAFFSPLLAAGGEFRRFNPLHPLRFGVRDHRKLLVCDEAISFLGGFNVADEYAGDGVTAGWCDLGVRIESADLAAKLAASFSELFALAEFHDQAWRQFRAFRRRRTSRGERGSDLLLARPGRGASPFQSALYRQLKRARCVQIVTPYFLPTLRLRRELVRVVRQGGRVQLVLAGKTDVPLSQLAARSLYRRLLKAGIEIYEYQPQILHAKLVRIDDVVFAGSSNFDIRSLNLNYELMFRMDDAATARGAEIIFARLLEHSRKIERHAWRQAQTFWGRWRHRWAHFLLTRIDPFVALFQFRRLRR